MKYIFSLLFISFIFLQSCQIEHVDKDKREMAKKRLAEKQKQRKAEKIKQKKQKKKEAENPTKTPKVVKERMPTPDFDLLTASRKQTLGAINQVNGQYPMMAKESIKITSDKILIKGTAIDRPLTKAPSGAYIKIGTKLYPVENWLPRQNYADKSKNPDYLMTGFTVEIPTADFNPGTKVMTLMVVSADRKNYYTVNEKVKIII